MSEFMFEVYDEDNELVARGESAEEQACFNEGMKYLTENGFGCTLRLWESLGEISLVEEFDDD